MKRHQTQKSLLSQRLRRLFHLQWRHLEVPLRVDLHTLPVRRPGAVMYDVRFLTESINSKIRASGTGLKRSIQINYSICSAEIPRSELNERMQKASKVFPVVVDFHGCSSRQARGHRPGCRGVRLVRLYGRHGP